MKPAKRDDPLRYLRYEPKHTTWNYLVLVDIPAGMIWPTIEVPAAEQGGEPTLYGLEPTFMNRDWALMFRILRDELTWEPEQDYVPDAYSGS